MPGKEFTMSSNTTEAKKQQGKNSLRIIGIVIILLIPERVPRAHPESTPACLSFS